MMDTMLSEIGILMKFVKRSLPHQVPDASGFLLQTGFVAFGIKRYCRDHVVVLALEL